ncbi:MAG: 2-phospho-L-lactate transferase CofD family protein, partial [Coriobacteriia bacterium]|nr:2-phospho-L-lactate transferase CofD family protein [Coriobacteriia bacterium]
MEGQPVKKAVVIGGGTGAPVSIRALLSLGLQTTAVVAMADDGGSSGLLREHTGAVPPGDIRKCLVAMAAEPDAPWT